MDEHHVKAHDSGVSREGVMAKINTKFGAHHFEYDTEIMAGVLTAYSFYAGSWRGSVSVDVRIGGSPDLVSLVIAAKLAQNGRRHGFTTEFGRFVKFEPGAEGAEITFGGERNTAKFSLTDLQDMELLGKDVLRKSGMTIIEIDSAVGVI
jgi:hypothetical protein